MELKQSDTINKYDKEIKHFQESASLFYKDAQKLYKEDVERRKNN